MDADEDEHITKDLTLTISLFERRPIRLFRNAQAEEEATLSTNVSLLLDEIH